MNSTPLKRTPSNPLNNKEIRRVRQQFSAKPPVLCVIGHSDSRIWGLTSKERFKRIVKPFGIVDVRDQEDAWPSDGQVVLIRLDYVVEDRVIHGLIARHFGKMLIIEDQQDGDMTIPVAAHVGAADARKVADLLAREHLTAEEALSAGVLPAGLTEISSVYNRKLRKREDPYVMALNEHSVDAIEKHIFDGAYKGITDFVTKYAWPLPARWVTHQAVRFGWTPNGVTTASLVLTIITLMLFMQGQFLAGIAVGFVMTFLDTVDGKLARVTLTSSRWGNIFDHAIDLIHPPFWYAAWWYGLQHSDLYNNAPVAYLDTALWIITIGYVIGRLLELAFGRLFGIQIHTWQPIDSFFRLITARRNPNLVLLMLTALIGRPDLGLLLLAVWTGVSLLFHGIRLLQAMAQRENDGLRSWLMGPT